MPKKNYSKRIADVLASRRSDPDMREFDDYTEDTEVDYQFDVIYDTVREDLRRRKPRSTISLAFREAKLNPRSPFAWWEILQGFTDIHYRTRKPGRAPVQRTRKFKSLFRRRLQAIINQQQRFSLIEACKQLTKDFPEEYAASPARWRRCVNEFRWSKATFEAGWLDAKKNRAQSRATNEVQGSRSHSPDGRQRAPLQ